MSEIDWKKEFKKAEGTIEYKLEGITYNLAEKIIELMERKDGSRTMYKFFSILLKKL